MPTKWDDKALACLCTSIFSVLSTESLTQEHKDSVVSLMKENGFPDITWNGIRHTKPLYPRDRQQPPASSQIIPIMPRFEDIKGDLMEAFFYLNPPTKDQQAQIVEFLRGRGHDMTWDAIRQHLQKLKRKEPGGGAGGADGGPKTPAKRGGRGGGASGSKRKAKAVATVQDDDDLAEEAIQTPSKKPRVKRETKPKAEAAEFEDPLQLDGVKNEIDDLDAAAAI
ncbi:hypothetical protein MAPG_00710 [Magnaporthiopsis poae ATCC 64411]|uniref:Uncharacterized protein n=1 Tax=Magnaporthiopsis poae (strain ATCC 64411 / 73-15) TaxID=644358 RepID=A0A0C4DLR5_MAGP6|nr:hypothetical protein MAPG_00710 [Magnaporthiopsis poae ATCC 64411]